MIGPLDGADSQIIRAAGEATIMISDRITDPGQRKFLIMHECGHLMLEHPLMPPHKLGEAGPSRHTPDHVRDYEAEANAFASELTMPHVIVNRWCRATPVNLDMPWRIANAFGMTILASAIRFTELSPERCAAVFSARRRIVWCAESATFPKIERGRALDPTSAAYDFWERGEVEPREQFVPADGWFDTKVPVDIVEHAFASREHGTVISMLWVPERVAAPLGMAT
ncbi:MAG TPA: ImmA/IrrE family metallo-endopeptidase [Kofleriaceae bacterium]|nr:ImmA/IrrE family metallo-endopeptidase [Kofleriaceae bacterium]